MRLPEIAQSPAQQGDNRDNIQPAEHIHIRRAFCFDNCQCSIKPADRHNHHNRCQDQGENHQCRLHGICPAYRQEPAEEGIGNSCPCPEPHGFFITDTEGAFKQQTTGHDAGSTVNGEENQDHGCRDNPQNTAFILKTLRKVIRQRQRMVDFRLKAQTTGNNPPVKPGTDTQTDGNPGFGNTGEENHTR